MGTRLDVETLEHAVELVHLPDVVAVNVDLRVTRLDLQPQRAFVARGGRVGRLRGGVGGVVAAVPRIVERIVVRAVSVSITVVAAVIRIAVAVVAAGHHDDVRAAAGMRNRPGGTGNGGA